MIVVTIEMAKGGLMCFSSISLATKIYCTQMGYNPFKVIVNCLLIWVLSAVHLRLGIHLLVKMSR